MNEIVEAVARAIAPEAWEGFEDYCRLKELTEDEIAEKKERHVTIKSSVKAARAAIEAYKKATAEQEMRDQALVMEAANRLTFAPDATPLLDLLKSRSGQNE